MKIPTHIPGRRGFTLVELLVVALVAGAVVLLTVAPALGRTRASAEEQTCRQNLRSLAAAWTLYAADHNGQVVHNVSGGDAGGGSGFLRYSAWAMGWMDWSTSNDNTNTLLVASPQYSKLAPYTGGQARLFRCPTDRHLSTPQMVRGWTGRARSYSSPSSVGIGPQASPGDPNFRQVRFVHELIYPTPSDAMIFLEEHPDSINDPSFFSPSANVFTDHPSTLHDVGMNMGMADGSVARLAWTGTMAQEDAQRIKFNNLPPAPRFNDPDLKRVRYHIPRLNANY